MSRPQSARDEAEIRLQAQSQSRSELLFAAAESLFATQGVFVP